MARWICNADLPGSFLQGRGIVKTGQEFETPDDPEDPFFERARETWLPQDSAAEKLVAKSKKDTQAIIEKSARAAAIRRQAEEDAKNGILTREFETRPDRIAQQFGTNPTAAFAQGEEEQKRNDAWTKIVRRQQKKGSPDDEVRDTVQDVVREQQALAGGAAAQPVVDPNAASAAAQNNSKKK